VAKIRAGRKLGRSLGTTILLGIKVIIGYLPPRVLHLIAKGMSTALYLFFWKGRSRALQTLSPILSLPQDSKEIRRLVKDNFYHMYMLMQEIFEYCYLTPPEIKNGVEIKGLEYLKSALDKGKGVICLSAHLGNFPLIAIRLSSEGYPFNILIRKVNNDKIESLFSQLREKFGIKTIYRGQSYHPLVRVLKRNEILWLFVDQFPRRGDIEAEFLGCSFPVYTGPVRLARVTGALLVPITITRLEPKKHCIQIFPPLIGEDDPSRLMQKILEIADRQVRLNPAQWLWWHKKWLLRRVRAHYSAVNISKSRLLTNSTGMSNPVHKEKDKAP
jgi:KDO2-lipid IV(A) lauroyltransferase